MGYSTIPVTTSSKPDKAERDDLIAAVNERGLDLINVDIYTDGNYKTSGFTVKKHSDLLSMCVDGDLGGWEADTDIRRAMTGVGMAGLVNLVDLAAWHYWNGTDFVLIEYSNIWTLAGIASYSHPEEPPLLHIDVPNQFATLLSQLNWPASKVVNRVWGYPPRADDPWVGYATGCYYHGTTTLGAATVAAHIEDSIQHLTAMSGSDNTLGWHGQGSEPFNAYCQTRVDVAIDTDSTRDEAVAAWWTADSLTKAKLLIQENCFHGLYGAFYNGTDDTDGKFLDVDVYVNSHKVGSMTLGEAAGKKTYFDVDPSYLNYSGDTTISLRMASPIPGPDVPFSPPAELWFADFSPAGGTVAGVTGALPSAKLFYGRAYEYYTYEFSPVDFAAGDFA
jgi:hypothetical protein